MIFNQQVDLSVTVICFNYYKPEPVLTTDFIDECCGNTCLATATSSANSVNCKHTNIMLINKK